MPNKMKGPRRPKPREPFGCLLAGELSEGSSFLAEPQGSNRLPVLAQQIREDIHLARQSATEMAERMLSIGRLLTEAKASVVHGEWASWLAANVGLSQRTASRYMLLIKRGVETATVADLGLRGAMETDERPRQGSQLSAPGSDAEVAAAMTAEALGPDHLEKFVSYLEAAGDQGLLDFQLALLKGRWKAASAKVKSDFLARIKLQDEPQPHTRRP